MKRHYFIFLLVVASTNLASAQETSNSDLHAPIVVERVSFDWDHSGTPTTFTLSYQHGLGFDGDADRLVIYRKGNKPWILLNKDDVWTTLSTAFIPRVLSKNNLLEFQKNALRPFKHGS